MQPLELVYCDECGNSLAEHTWNEDILKPGYWRYGRHWACPVDEEVGTGGWV